MILDEFIRQIAGNISEPKFYTETSMNLKIWTWNCNLDSNSSKTTQKPVYDIGMGFKIFLKLSIPLKKEVEELTWTKKGIQLQITHCSW